MGRQPVVLMETSEVLGVGLGLVAYLLSNLGMGVQKAGACSVVARGRGFGTWSKGTAMTLSASFLFFPAFGLARASVLAPLEGVGLAALALYASRVLHERLTARHFLALGAIILGMALTGAAGALPRQPGEAFRPEALAPVAAPLVGASVAVAALLALARWLRCAPLLSRGIAGCLLGGAAGVCAGVAMILQKLVGGQLLSRLAGLFSEPFLLLFFLVAGIGFVLLQVAWLNGTAVEVVASYSSMTILVPSATASILFGEPATWGLRAGTLLVIAGVVLIARQAALGREPAARNQDGGTP